MVISGEAGQQQAAPGALEQVRELLNTWTIPNDTREPTDDFEDYARDKRLAPADATALRALRDGLRPAVERTPDADARLNALIRRLKLRPTVADEQIVYTHEAGPAGDLLAEVLAAVNAGRWARLKACPDCHWVFYDHTRNGGKRWCLMYAGGPGGRACGTIAKVRRHREKQAGADSV
jgi:hypothetical protein